MKIDRVRRIVQTWPAGHLRALLLADFGWLLFAVGILMSGTPRIPALLALAGSFVVLVGLGGALGVVAAALDRYETNFRNIADTQDLLLKTEQLRHEDLALSRKTGRA